MNTCLSIEQNPQNPLTTTALQLPVLPRILEIKDLLLLIVSFMDKKYHSVLASTCKYLNDYYKQCCEERTFFLLYGLQFEPSLCFYYIKALEHRWIRIGWIHSKVNIIRVPANFQNYHTHPITDLHLEEPFKVPDGLKYTIILPLYWVFLRKQNIN
jgi:hypothetical protein